MKRTMLLTVICIFFSMPSAFSASDGSEQGGFIQYPKADGYYESMVQAGKPQAAATYTNSIGMEFTLIPTGTLPYISRTFTPHKTFSKPFYLGTYEVTQAQWEAVMGNNPAKFKGRHNPVEMVSWDDVQAFIKALNTKEGHSRYRLPTEAEWEYAARAGTTTDFSFGDNYRFLDQYAWFMDNSDRTTHPVGQKTPNPWGLYDMHGNVKEWVYTSSRGSFQGAGGGDYSTNEWGCVSYSKGSKSQDSREHKLGFRLFLSPE